MKDDDKVSAPPLRKYILISLCFHLSLVGLFYSLPKIFSFQKKDYKVVWVELPPGVGNDIEAIKEAKGLPRSSIQDQKQSLEKLEAKEADKPKDATEEGAQKLEEKSPEEKKPEELPPPPEEKKPEEKAPEKPPEETVKIEEKKEEPKPEPKPEPEPKKEEPKPEPVKKQAPKKQPSVLDQKIQAALQKNKQAVETTRTPIESAQIKDPGEGVGSASTLTDARMSDPIFAAYYVLIRARINREWITAPKLFDASESLRAKILLVIDKDGLISSVQFEQSSGNYSFDLSAKRAVERSSPLPTPPPELADEIVNEGFLIEFSPTQVMR